MHWAENQKDCGVVGGSRQWLRLEAVDDGFSKAVASGDDLGKGV